MHGSTGQLQEVAPNGIADRETVRKAVSRTLASRQVVDRTLLDRKLVERVRKGDRAAFGELYSAYERRVFGYCLQICRNPDDAADAASESFATVLRRLPELGEIKNFGGYLFVVARNSALKTIKRNSKTTPTAELEELEQNDGVAAEEDPERALLLADQQRQVVEANNNLAPRQREALLLKELQGLTYVEVGERMGTTRNSVAQLIFRARIQLRAAMREASVALPIETSSCRKALPLMSQRVDGELDPQQSEWLDEHLSKCAACKANLEAVEEAGATYRSVLPWIVAPAVARAFATENASASTVDDLSHNTALQERLQHRGSGSEGTSKSRTAKSRRRACTATVAAALLVLIAGATLGDAGQRLIGGSDSPSATGTPGTSPAGSLVAADQDLATSSQSHGALRSHANQPAQDGSTTKGPNGSPNSSGSGDKQNPSGRSPGSSRGSGSNDSGGSAPGCRTCGASRDSTVPSAGSSAPFSPSVGDPAAPAGSSSPTTGVVGGDSTAGGGGSSTGAGGDSTAGGGGSSTGARGEPAGSRAPPSTAP